MSLHDLLQLSKGGTNKNAFVFLGGIHAREWISPATVIYMTDLVSILDVLVNWFHLHTLL